MADKNDEPIMEEVSGINEFSKNSDYLYPNPTSGKFTISLQEAGLVTIENAVGSIVCEVVAVKGQNTIELPVTLSNGTYIVYAKTTGKPIYKKLVLLR